MSIYNNLELKINCPFCLTSQMCGFDIDDEYGFGEKLKLGEVHPFIKNEKLNNIEFEGFGTCKKCLCDISIKVKYKDKILDEIVQYQFSKKKDNW